MDDTGRAVLREQLAAHLLLNVLRAEPAYVQDVTAICGSASPAVAAAELSREYGRGMMRDVVAHILERAALTAAEEPACAGTDSPIAILGVRAHCVDSSREGRWVVAAPDGEITFFDDGEQEARALAAELGVAAYYRPPDAARPGRYALGAAFIVPLARGAALVASRRAGRCLGWHEDAGGRRPCRNAAIAGPYCRRHGRWEFRVKRGAWEVEREEDVRRLARLAASHLRATARQFVRQSTPYSQRS